MVCSQIKIKHYDNFQLTNFNTLRIKSIAKQFWLPDNSGELVSLLKKFKDKNPIVIGNGSNILFSSKPAYNILYSQKSMRKHLSDLEIYKK